jgi:CDP-glucose 4,6-dehydratase
VLDSEKSIEHIIGDIRNFELINNTIKNFNPDIVFHLAAQPLVRDSYDDPRYTYNVNIMGTVNVLEAIRLNKIRAGVIITTDKVYKNFEKNIAYKEGDQLGGYDPYSNSKACADMIVDSYIKSFFNPEKYNKSHQTLVASARAGNVIGGGDWAKDRLVPDAIRAFLLDNKPLMIRSPRAIRPWQHVFEPLCGYLLLGVKLYEGQIDKAGAWNFGPEKDGMQSVEKVLKIMIKKLEKGRAIVREDKTKHEASLLKLDNSKAKILLGWEPKLNLSEAVSETADWYKEYFQNKLNIKKLSLNQINKYFS